MKIFSWSDPKYFHFAYALVNSIRYHGNKHDIILHLMDFDQKQQARVEAIFEEDPGITTIFSQSSGDHLSQDRFQYYRNSRPGFFLRLLEEYDEPLLTLGANGIVRCKLDFIEEILKSKDFVFRERTKGFGKYTVRTIHELDKLIKAGKIVNPTVHDYARCVLLGTHAMANNKMVKKVITKWTKVVNDPKLINKQYSDMGLFVKCLLEVEQEEDYMFGLDTGFAAPKNCHPYCDTTFNPDSNIWFAKSKTKWEHGTYLGEVERFNIAGYDGS